MLGMSRPGLLAIAAQGGVEVMVVAGRTFISRASVEKRVQQQAEVA
jgi:hypothetical protein